MNTERSLTGSVLRWMLAPLCLLSLAFLAEAFVTTRQATEQLHDQMLVAAAISISEAVDRTYGDLVEDDIISLLRNTTGERIYYKIVGPDNSYVTGYEDFHPLPTGVIPESGIPALSEVAYRGEDLRAVSLRFFSADSLIQGWIDVHVGMTKLQRSAMMREALSDSVMRLVGTVVAVILLTLIAVNRALRPLRQFREEIARRSITDLSPIGQSLPRDIRPISDALNDLMRRLTQAIEREREFLANASHQLRSPLAALQLKAQLALRQTGGSRAALAEILMDTRQTTRLADQILSFSRAEMEDAAAHEAVDLGALIRASAPSLLAAAQKLDCDIGFDLPEVRVDIIGQAVLLREVVVNLCDNAMRYGGPNPVVDVALSQTDGRVTLSVSDQGPGIAPTDRERVFHRFVRGTEGEGTGLGLAIVARIIKAHGADLVLHSRPEFPGTQFSIQFPAAAIAKS